MFCQDIVAKVLEFCFCFCFLMQNIVSDRELQQRRVSGMMHFKTHSWVKLDEVLLP